jgi:hypothetical protein
MSRGFNGSLTNDERGKSGMGHNVTWGRRAPWQKQEQEQEQQQCQQERPKLFAPLACRHSKNCCLSDVFSFFLAKPQGIRAPSNSLSIVRARAAASSCRKSFCCQWLHTCIVVFLLLLRLHCGCCGCGKR